MTLKLILFAAAALAHGCGKAEEAGEDQNGGKEKTKVEETSTDKDTNDPTVTAPFISPSDLASTTVRSLIYGDISSQIKNQPQFYAIEPDDSNGEEPSPCEKLINSLKAKVSNNTLTLASEIDLSECTREMALKTFPNAQISATAKYKIYRTLKCNSDALLGFDGKTFSNLKEKESFELCAEASTIEEFTNIETITKLDISVPETPDAAAFTHDIEERTLIAWMTTNGEPCSKTRSGSTLTLAKGCTYWNRSIYTKAENPANSGKDDVVKLEFVDVSQKEEKSSPWFATGKVNIILNDWSGFLEYKGATTSPTWSMSKGPETVSGTLRAKTEFRFSPW